MTQEEKQAMLQAMKDGDEERVADYACRFFIKNGGQCNYENMKAFEYFSGCNIVPLERDGFGWLVGGIKWQGKTFSYG